MSEKATDTNPLALSDEDFLNQPAPGTEVVAPTEQVQETPLDKSNEESVEVNTPVAKVEPGEVEVDDESNVAATTTPPGKPGVNGGNVPTNAEVKQESGKAAATASAPEAKSTDEAGKDSQGKPASATTDEGKPAGKPAAVDYESEYKRLMAPLKANGKQIELRSIDEAISLMQMGANYTRKMQDIAPHRKTLLMLENNQLLDPDQLSFLIDVKNGNPQAIQKLLKDKGIDPMSIDTSEDSNYLGGNHKVSDEEANFQSALSDLSHAEGKKTIQLVNDTWDQASKEVLWKEPGILGLMHQQRENGVYDRISAEVDRQRTMGTFPANLPFIQAYKVVGDAMQKVGAFDDLFTQAPIPSSGSSEAAATPAAAAKEPVATRVVAPKPAVSNGDQASAAAATRSTPREVKKFVNPLALSDDDFLKQMENRV